MVETYGADRRERRLIDVTEFPAAVFRQRAAGLAIQIRVPEDPHQQLVNYRPFGAIRLTHRRFSYVARGFRRISRRSFRVLPA